MSTQPPKPKRRWYQFSLKTLLLVMSVLSLTFGGWIQFRRQRAQENRDRVATVKKAVVAIEGMGGWVAESLGHEERRQTWLEKQFDDPGGDDDPVIGWIVTQVDFAGTLVTDADLEHVKVLIDLEELYIYGQVTDAGLKHLRALTSLKRLKLTVFGPNLTDAGLEHLKGLTNLVWLDVRNTQITDEGLHHLKGMTELQILAIRGTQITEEGVKNLQQALPNCDITYHDYYEPVGSENSANRLILGISVFDEPPW